MFEDSFDIELVLIADVFSSASFFGEDVLEVELGSARTYDRSSSKWLTTVMFFSLFFYFGEIGDNEVVLDNEVSTSMCVDLFRRFQRGGVGVIVGVLGDDVQDFGLKSESKATGNEEVVGVELVNEDEGNPE